MNRRSFTTAAAALPLALRGQEQLPPVRAITKGPKYHWFGYYDKLQFSADNRYVLGMEVGFEHRSPTAEDTIRIGMVDLKDNDRWIDLGETHAWCWQQGCMLQWLPGSKDEVIYNDRADGQFVSHILNVHSGKKRTLPTPIYSVSPDAKWAIAPDFSRLVYTRPGYGYAGVPDKYRSELAPTKSGIWRMNLASGKTDLIIPVAEAAAVPYKLGPWDPPSRHRFNHLLYSPDGSRFIFLHRRTEYTNKEAGMTRMFTASAEGKDLYVVDPYGDTSHFIWRDPQTIMAWATHPSHGYKFYLYKDKTTETAVIGGDVMTVNGHNTYLPGNKWILNDTYPDKERLTHPYLYHVRSGKRIPLGHFKSPTEYAGEWRCDNHPRYSRDGRMVTIDSPHGGNGRQIYLIDISAIVRREPA